MMSGPLAYGLSSTKATTSLPQVGLNRPIYLPVGKPTFLGEIAFAILGPKIGLWGGTPICGQNSPNRAQVAPKGASVSQAFGGAKQVKMGPKLPKYAPQTFPKRPRSFVYRPVFDNFWAQNWPLWGSCTGGNPAVAPPPSTARYGVLRVRLGHFEGVETTKPRGWTADKCPRNRHLGRPAQDIAFFLVSMPGTPDCTQNGPRLCLKGQIQAFRGPNKPAQRVCDHSWAKLFWTILGPKIGHFGGPMRWAALPHPPSPSSGARYRVLQDGNHQTRRVALRKSALGIAIRAVQPSRYGHVYGLGSFPHICVKISRI